jgi:flagellar protein FlbD
MITLTRLDRSPVVVNCELIGFIENNPETVITMTNDCKITVRETAPQVVEKVWEWRRSLTAWERAFGARDARHD